MIVIIKLAALTLPETAAYAARRFLRFLRMSSSRLFVRVFSCLRGCEEDS